MQKKNKRPGSAAQCRAAANANAAYMAKSKRPEVIAKRFWSKVDKRGTDECWPWVAVTGTGGYGHFSIQGRMARAHRQAFILTNGPIPDGLDCCHKCDNPPCCNPAHLFIGTTSENLNDCVAKGRYNRPNGERCHLAKLTAGKVRTIRKLFAGGTKRATIARRFGVTWESIDAVVKRKSWKHI